MTRDEAENLPKWPEGYRCSKCGNTEIKCFGEEDEGEMRFGCVACGHSWSEAIEDDEAYLAEQAYQSEQYELLQEAKSKARKGIVDHEMIAKINFPFIDQAGIYRPQDLTDALAVLREWDLVDEIIGKALPEERAGYLDNSAPYRLDYLAKQACRDLHGLQRYVELMEKYQIWRFRWPIREEYVDPQCYENQPLFIQLIIRLWQHHQKLGKNQFIESPCNSLFSDSSQLFRFKERFWNEMDESQQEIITEIEVSARTFLAVREREDEHSGILQDAIARAEQGLVEREMIAKIRFSTTNIYSATRLIDALASLNDWDLIEEIVGKFNGWACEALYLTTPLVAYRIDEDYLAKRACRDLHGLQRYTALMEQYLRWPFVWPLHEEYVAPQCYEELPQFIDLNIRLWQLHQKLGENQFIERPDLGVSDRHHFFRFKERFWGEMNESQQEQFAYIEKQAGTTTNMPTTQKQIG